MATRTDTEIINQEMKMRIKLWEKVNDFQNCEGNVVNKEFLEKNRVAVGERGIYRDKERTKFISSDSYGVTVAVRHTPGRYGGRYPNRLFEDSLLYHYPATRQPSHDQGDINATKTCMKLKLPIFIVITDKKTKNKKVKFGWVIDFDDEKKIFLIEFGEKEPSLDVNLGEETPFRLTDTTRGGRALAVSRPNQGKFRYALLKNYGFKCAVCSIEVSELLNACHIRGKDNNGSDDWRNGILLCLNHHAAFDNNLFRIDPTDFKIICDRREDLKIEENKLKTQTGTLPHVDALSWRWNNSR